jgi:hypothetical protein
MWRFHTPLLYMSGEVMKQTASDWKGKERRARIDIKVAGFLFWYHFTFTLFKPLVGDLYYEAGEMKYRTPLKLPRDPDFYRVHPT